MTTATTPPTTHKPRFNDRHHRPLRQSRSSRAISASGVILHSDSPLQSPIRSTSTGAAAAPTGGGTLDTAPTSQKRGHIKPNRHQAIWRLAGECQREFQDSAKEGLRKWDRVSVGRGKCGGGVFGRGLVSFARARGGGVVGGWTAGGGVAGGCTAGEGVGGGTVGEGGAEMD